MHLYTLNTFLQFLEAQRIEGYGAIETILGILKEKNIPDDDKQDAILFTLRRNGMNEITHKDGRYEPSVNTDSIPKKIDRPVLEVPYEAAYQVQMITLHMLSGEIHIEVPLN